MTRGVAFSLTITRPASSSVKLVSTCPDCPVRSCITKPSPLDENANGTLAAAYRGHPEVATELTLTGFGPNEHTVIWYDDSTGVELSRATVDGTELVLQTPVFRKHLAFVVR